MPDTDSTSVYCQIDGYVVDEQKIKILSRHIGDALGVARHELSIGFVGPEEIRQLNSEFRGIDKSTDVLSFPQCEFETPLTTKTPFVASKKQPRGAPPEILGDVVISLPDAARNAADIGQALDREVCFLLVHGILHLCGHDHIEPEEERVMLEEQRILMDGLAAGTLWAGCAVKDAT